ncbi:MAG: phosphoadenylyl-sulfate reductase [Bacteroidales bacterium]|nr:phosphoadenylyl-sulfate reductase [Bacteroidales bacterium]
MNFELLKKLNEQTKEMTSFELLSFLINQKSEDLAFATSLGAEDQVITEIIALANPSTRIFVLDTGRLFPETYDLIESTKSRYKINIEIFFPNTESVENMVNKKGINLFYNSFEDRKLCCSIRKVEPLKRALKNVKIWITGLRNEHSENRAKTSRIEWDNANGLIKVNPLIDWNEKDVWDYINKKNIPFNPLYKKGFKSIGCQPCTRAVNVDENQRDGRWWWENIENKECGLHER